MGDCNMVPAKRRSSRMAEREQRAEEAKRKQFEESVANFIDAINAHDLTRETFDLFPTIVPLPLPPINENFSIPVSWVPVPTPKPYRNITVNKYIAPLSRPTISEEDIPLCSCTPDTGCGDDCHNRQLYMECPLNYCKAVLPGDTHCYNTAIQTRTFPEVEVFLSTCGFGLRVLEDIPANTPIIEYCGEVITSTECQRRLRQYSITDNFYFAALESGLILDANVYGSAARFANHSCDPNCELQKWNVLGESRLLLVSTRGLMAMTELTYNYQYCDDGLDAMMDMMRQPCRCGASYCGGTIGGKLDTSTREKWFRKTTTMLQGVTRKYTLEEMMDHLDMVKFSPTQDNAKIYLTLPCPEHEQLEQHIAKAQQWLISFEELASSSSLIDAAALEEILNCAPSGVKFVDVPIYEKKLQNHAKATKLLRLATENLDWETFIVIVNESVTALPCRVEGMDSLLSKYQSCSNWAATHTHRRAPSTHTTWQAIQRIGEAYRIHVTGEWFAYLDELSVGLDKYVNRCQLEKMPWNRETNVLLPFLKSPLHTMSEDATPLKTIKSGVTHKKEQVLYCFCRQPETSGECNTMMVCDGCEQWYHPLCCNIDAREVKKNSDDLLFYCPLCQSRESVMQHFAVIGPEEWHIYPKSDSDKHWFSTWSTKDLYHDIAYLGKLPIDKTPVQALLKLKWEFVEKWISTIQGFREVFQAHNEHLCLEWCDDKCTMIISKTTREEEIALLHQAMVLYFDLRVIHVCPDEVAELRGYIWQLSVMPMLRRLQIEETGSDDMMTLYLARNVLSAGAAFGCKSSAQWKLLNRASAAWENLLSEVASASMAELVASYNSLEMRWQLFRQYFDLTEGYQAARLSNAIVSQRHILSRRENEIGNSAETICWCGKDEDEEGMVCCDKCDVWFHYSCIGLRTSKMIKNANEADTFLCIHCSELEGNDYKYLWK